MGLKICLDTNVFVSVINKEPLALACKKIMDHIEKKQLEAVVSTIVISEICVGFYQNHDDQIIPAFLDNLKKNYQIIPVTEDIALKSAEIKAFSNLKLPDALIYATSLMNNVNFLVSNNFSVVKSQKKTDPQVVTPDDFVKNILHDF